MGRRKLLRLLALTTVLFPISESFGADPARRTFNLDIRKRKVTAAEKTIRLTEGDKVEIIWTTDETVDVHLHGYDVLTPVVPGETAVMTFQAHTAGRFPISAHRFGHKTLVYLEIYPK